MWICSGEPGISIVTVTEDASSCPHGGEGHVWLGGLGLTGLSQACVHAAGTARRVAMCCQGPRPPPLVARFELILGSSFCDIALVCSGHHSRGAYQPQMRFLVVLRLVVWGQGARAVGLSWVTGSSSCLPWWRASAELCGCSVEDTNPAQDLIVSQRPHLLTPSPWAFACEVWGYTPSGHSTGESFECCSTSK